MRYLPILVAIALFWTTPCVDAQTPLSTTTTPAVSEICAIAEDFFSKFETLDVQTAMKALFAIFPLNQQAQDAFVIDVTNLKTKLGTPTGHEFIGYRPFGSTQRYFVVYFLTFHPRMPVAWEFTFYKPEPNAPWQLNFIRFDADDIQEFLEFTKLQFESLRRQNSAPSGASGHLPAEHLSEPPAPAVGELIPATAPVVSAP
ncbi:MAG TPA: hypothetical protein PLU72_13095 [Candidatus Ozemobacteraceae bacterium]|nr:hypothetical protein [Candidatus Ozemobacteraceae bacterium]HQG27953.1 hypothetical protein [Candidatus Ozemobacteraceae bacterium]